MSGHIKCRMFCITKSYIQAIASVKKSDQHSLLSLFFNTSYSSALICMSVHIVLQTIKNCKQFLS